MKTNFLKIPFFIFKNLAIVGFFLMILTSACYTTEPSVVPTPTAKPAPTEAVPATPTDKVVITWHRDGGIAGFCDSVSILSGGTAKVSSFKLNETREVVLSADKMRQINQWLNNLKGFSYQHKDNAVADAMNIDLVFSGNGMTEATDADRQAILDWVSQIALQANQ